MIPAFHGFLCMGSGTPSDFSCKNGQNFDLVCSCGSWVVLVASLGRPGSVLGALGGVLGRSWGLWVVLEPFEAVLGPLGTVLAGMVVPWRARWRTCSFFIGFIRVWQPR